MKTLSILLSALAAFGCATLTHAEGLAVTLSPVSAPMGLGADLTYRLSDHFSVRAGGGIPATVDVEKMKFGDVKYDTTLKFGGVNAFVDYYPFKGNFHVSGGISTVRDGWTLEGSKISTYKINDTSYPADGVGLLKGTVDIQHRVGPALLVGWGNPVRSGKRWGVAFDLGLQYVGKEDFSLTANGPLASDAAFKRDLAAEMAERSADHAFWAIVKVGVSYQF